MATTSRDPHRSRATAHRTRPASVQGYLAHEKHPSRRTLHQPYAKGPMVVLGLGGWVLLMREVPLYTRLHAPHRYTRGQVASRISTLEDAIGTLKTCHVPDQHTR